jgi:hypothetical protein
MKPSGRVRGAEWSWRSLGRESGAWQSQDSLLELLSRGAYGLKLLRVR